MQNEVRIASGRLAGIADAGIRIWRGIPYAAAPVGAGRWRAPQPVPAWDGVRDASRFGCDSVQAPMPASRAPSMREDCLYANVWAPADALAGERPVMVWLHGGGFVGGSGADARCEGRWLAGRGVVVVTFNYRAGLFGYFAHPGLSGEANGTSGNYGLLDQLAALQWVQENIAAFGGDPARVTVFGVSAGSASIALLLTSPAAAGLFQHAILHSPGTARPLASLADAERAGRTLGDDIDALRDLPADRLFALTSKLTPAMRGLTTPRVLRPIRDGHLIPEDERDAFAAGRLHAMPIIVGTNSDEGTLLTRNWPIATLADHRAALAANFADDLEQALALYPALRDADARPAIAQAFADTQFNDGARLLLRAMTRLGMPCWRYLFSRRRPGQNDGPHHGDEVAHLFGNLAAGRGVEALPFDEADVAVSNAMAAAWVAFATDADPNAAGVAAWPRYDASTNDGPLAFGDRIEVVADARTAQLDFLDAYFAARSPSEPRHRGDGQGQGI
jgi:para-nitrobenzyl esterase